MKMEEAEKTPRRSLGVRLRVRIYEESKYLGGYQGIEIEYKKKQPQHWQSKGFLPVKKKRRSANLVGIYGNLEEVLK